MPKIRVGVLRGGPSSEYDVSLKTGSAVLKNLPSKYKAMDILLSKDGVWHLNGFSSYPGKIFQNVDVVFNCLHGEFGEDGKVQQIFESFNVPYTGSGIFSSSLGMNKILSKQSFKRAGIRVPKGIVLSDDGDPRRAARRIFQSMSPSWVVKPSSGGSSIGVSVAHNFSDLVSAISKAFEYGQKILVEEHIKGREAACGVVEHFRNQEYYSLPPVEIVPPPLSPFFDYNAKYSGETKELCPSGFDRETKGEIEKIAIKAHKLLGCRHYSRVDFIVSKGSATGEVNIYLLELNTLPGLTNESLLPKAVEAIGLSYSQFLDHLIKLTIPF
jgi:D-alanine--D-alanine ligase